MLSKECKVCVVVINCILSHTWKKSKICLGNLYVGNLLCQQN